MGLPLETWLQAIADGIALGWLYILMALGLTLILSIMGILQLAHGEIYMIGAYVVYYVTTSWGVNIYVGILISMVAMAGVGILLQGVLFRPRRNADPVLPSIVISTGLTLILSSLAVIGFGLYEKALPPLATGSVSLLGGTIPKDRVVAIGFSVAALVALYVFLKRTRWGQAMVASAQDREAALLRGINPNHMARMAFAIACALAALAGSLAGSILQLNPYMGSLPLVKGLVIIVLGGLGSIPGAAIGGMVLGLIDGIVPVAFGSVPAAFIPLVVVILIILIRPKGLFGHD